MLLNRNEKVLLKAFVIILGSCTAATPDTYGNAHNNASSTINSIINSLKKLPGDTDSVLNTFTQNFSSIAIKCLQDHADSSGYLQCIQAKSPYACTHQTTEAACNECLHGFPPTDPLMLKCLYAKRINAGVVGNADVPGFVQLPSGKQYICCKSGWMKVWSDAQNKCDGNTVLTVPECYNATGSYPTS